MRTLTHDEAAGVTAYLTKARGHITQALKLLGAEGVPVVDGTSSPLKHARHLLDDAMSLVREAETDNAAVMSPDGRPAP